MNKKWIPYTFFMFISPFVSVITSLRDNGIGLKTKEWILIIFITFYGSVMILKGDADDHQDRVNDHYVNLGFEEFSTEFLQIIGFQQPLGTTGDLYLHSLGYFVGSVLEIPGILFVFVAFIYAFFYVGSIFKILKLIQGSRITLILSSFLFAFLTWKTVHDLQTIRTWTGLWVMFYGGLQYFESGNKKWLLILLLPPFIHLGYFIMVIPVWVVIIFKNQKLLYSTLFVISFFTQIVPEQWALQKISQFPLGVNKIQSYYVEEKVEEKGEEAQESSENRRFYKEYQKSQLFKLGIYVPTFAFIILGTYFWSMTPLESYLFSTGLLSKALSNGMFFLFALTNRLDYIAGVFILGTLILLLSRGYEKANSSKIKKRVEDFSLWCGWAFLVPYFIFKLSEFVNFGSFFLILFPFVPWFTEINFSIKEFILEVI